MVTQRPADDARAIARGIAVVALLLPAAMLACAGPNAATPTPTSAAAGTPAASGVFEPGAGDSAGLVQVGDGREMYLECSGSGAPTVVLISGAGVAADNWRYVDLASDEPDDSAVYSQTARFTRVCAYDRPGTQQWQGAPSRSTTVSQPTTARADAADLHALLTAAEVAGPYVIVGHSWGGLIATTFARTYPDEVSGIVLVDPGSQYLQTVLPQEVWTHWMQLIAETGLEHPDLETPDYPASIAALESTPPLPTIPAVVLSADTPFDYLGIGDAQAHWPEWIEAHALLAASLGATHVTQTHSGHFVENENPALVLEQICSVAGPAQGC